MSSQNDDVARDVRSEQPVEAEKADDVGGPGDDAQDERQRAARGIS
jgi:hypothetical protein